MCVFVLIGHSAYTGAVSTETLVVYTLAIGTGRLLRYNAHHKHTTFHTFNFIPSSPELLAHQSNTYNVVRNSPWE